MNDSKKRSAFVGGVAILGIAGVVAKVIGMLFRIPLGNMLGTDGMGIYQTVYPVYTLLLTISAAGIPVAISRLVSENVAAQRHRQARAVLRASLIVLAIAGALLTVLMITLSGVLSHVLEDDAARLGFIAIAPSILIVSVMSAFRGYLQGRNQMTPTAISQVIEQVAKVAISLPLASLGMQTGLAEAAAGALLGITIGEGLALAYMAIVYAYRRRGLVKIEAEDPVPPSPLRTLMRQIIAIAVPITIGSMVVPLSGFIDLPMVRLRLMDIGMDAEAARSLYGLYSGHVLSLVNVPTVLATAVCIGLVPEIARARTEKRQGDMLETSRLGLRLASLISLPFTAGVALLGAPLLNLLYSGLPAETLQVGGLLLTISAVTIFLFTQVQASTGILQGAGHHKVPMYSLIVGVVLKVILNYVLIGMPQVGINGAAIASIACYAVSMVINLVYMVRKLGMKFDWGAVVIRPAIATAGMSAAVLLVTQVLDVMQRRNTLLAVLVGGIVYVVLLFVTGSLRREDMAQIPGGGRVEALLVKLHVWR